MDRSEITDKTIDKLIGIDKSILTPRARWKEQKGSKQKNYDVSSVDGEYNFKLYLRQNLRIQGDFSCGLVYVDEFGNQIPVLRYNGGAHVHENPLEEEKIEFQCHIHKTTERYALTSRYKLDHFATVTNKYSTLDEAFNELVKDCKIQSVITSVIDKANLDQQQLF